MYLTKNNIWPRKGGGINLHHREKIKQKVKKKDFTNNVIPHHKEDNTATSLHSNLSTNGIRTYITLVQRILFQVLLARDEISVGDIEPMK